MPVPRKAYQRLAFLGSSKGQTFQGVVHLSVVRAELQEKQQRVVGDGAREMLT